MPWRDRWRRSAAADFAAHPLLCQPWISPPWSHTRTVGRCGRRLTCRWARTTGPGYTPIHPDSCYFAVAAVTFAFAQGDNCGVSHIQGCLVFFPTEAQELMKWFQQGWLWTHLKISGRVPCHMTGHRWLYWGYPQWVRSPVPTGQVSP